MCGLQVLAREVKALRKQLETEKQQAAAKEAEHAAQEAAKKDEHTAREAEFAAKETELAAALEAARAAESSARKTDHSSEEAELACISVATPGDKDAVEPEALKEAEAAAAVTATPNVVEAVEHETGKEAEGASTSGGGGGSGGGGDSDLPHAAVVDTAAASDTGPSVQSLDSYKQLLQEVAALRQRLNDSSFEVVAGISVLCAEFQLLIASLFLLICYTFCRGKQASTEKRCNIIKEAKTIIKAFVGPLLLCQQKP